MRNICLFFTQEGRELNVQSEAVTLGQLQAESAMSSETLSGKKLTVKETRSTLETRDSVLPEGDFTLYVYPAKSKAGMTEDEEQTLLADINAIRGDLTNIKYDLGLILERINILLQSHRDQPSVPTGPVSERVRQLQEDAAKLKREMEGDYYSGSNGEGQFQSGSDIDAEADDDDDNDRY